MKIKQNENMCDALRLCLCLVSVCVLTALIPNHFADLALCRNTKSTRATKTKETAGRSSRNRARKSCTRAKRSGLLMMIIACLPHAVVM